MALLKISLLSLLIFMFSQSVFGIEPSELSPASQSKAQSEVKHEVEIVPKAEDKQIKKRLENILKATGWYEEMTVHVENGIVFLKGTTKSAKHMQWAEQLANNTQSVVAVVNEIKVISTTSWYLTQIQSSINEQWQSFLRWLPFLGLALVILGLAWFAARFVTKMARTGFLNREFHPLLADVLAKGVALLCFLIGLYIVLRILGLSTIALTVLGGTGIIGIILGIAFRDITENLLASVLLSVQKPFSNQDLVEIEGIIGYVQSLTIRATILLTRDGHEVQIPNATVYKSNIYNFTSNPNRREHFVVGIGYDDSVSEAQAVALKVLEDHPAVLADPEPWILVDELVVSTVNLKIFFWLNSEEYHWRKVRSSVIRLVKRAFQDAEISMPGQAIELSMTEDISVKLLDAGKARKQKKASLAKESEDVETSAEGGLSSDTEEIQEQGRKIREAGQEKNLLKD